MENKLKHLEMIQGIINRMASNSFALKGWSVTLVAGIFALSSKDAKKLYTNATAAVLRAKECVMDTVTTVQENAEDIYEEAKQINEERAAEDAEMEAFAEADVEETEEVSEDAFKEVEE